MKVTKAIALGLACAAMSISSPATAASGVVVAKCRAWYLVYTDLGYAILEWYGGYDPAKGETIVGDFEQYGFKDLFNLDSRSAMNMWVEDFWLSERRAFEKFSKKCRR